MINECSDGAVFCIHCLDNDGYWKKRVIFMDSEIPGWQSTFAKRVMHDKNAGKMHASCRRVLSCRNSTNGKRHSHTTLM